MNQPKYKFGEKVFYGKGDYLIIEEIRWSDSYQDYEYNDSLMEKAIIREPQKKKLYAYKKWNQWHLGGSEMCNGYEVFHVADVDLPKLGLGVRAHEYDIEYPHSK